MAHTADTKRHTLEAAVLQLIAHRVTFSVSFLLVLALSFGALYTIGFTPEPAAGIEGNNAPSGAFVELSSPSAAVAAIAPLDDSPRRIIIDAIDVDATIVNPVSRDIDVLDTALRSGVVHYPGSGDLEDHSNMFLFGHSSYLPTVQNELYRVFNNLSKLEAGDIIRVQADGFEYRYAVSGVELVDATTALVELSNREKKLTISTCNSFGALTDRFVVEADFLGRVALSA